MVKKGEKEKTSNITSPAPTRQLAIISKSSHPVGMDTREADSLMAQLKVEEYSQVIKMRGSWSRFLMISLTFIIGFQMVLTLGVGLGWLKFEDEWLARILFPGLFIEVVGLVYVIINFLFPNKK